MLEEILLERIIKLSIIRICHAYAYITDEYRYYINASYDLCLYNADRRNFTSLSWYNGLMGMIAFFVLKRYTHDVVLNFKRKLRKRRASHFRT